MERYRANQRPQRSQQSQQSQPRKAVDANLEIQQKIGLVNEMLSDLKKPQKINNEFISKKTQELLSYGHSSILEMTKGSDPEKLTKYSSYCSNMWDAIILAKSHLQFVDNDASDDALNEQFFSNLPNNPYIASGENLSGEYEISLVSQEFYSESLLATEASSAHREPTRAEIVQKMKTLEAPMELLAIQMEKCKSEFTSCRSGIEELKKSLEYQESRSEAYESCVVGSVIYDTDDSF